MSLTKIGSIGINTGIAFAGVTTITTLNGSDAVLSVGGTVNFVSDVSIGGTVSIAGTLTYEDVTNVDSVGVITARQGIRIGAGQSIGSDGAAVVYYGDGSNLTGAGPTLANGSNDRVITATGANALLGEANLTFSGSVLNINGTSDDTPLMLDTTSNNGAHLRFRKDGSNQHFVGAGGGFSLGDKEDIDKCALDLNFDISNFEIIDEKIENKTSEIAADLASKGAIKIIVKGHIHTDVLMKEVIKKKYNLIGKTRLSHIWHMTLNKEDRPLIITDGALNVSPNVKTKMHILKNVINFCNRIGTMRPKISVLSATEEVLESVQSSLDAK